jgi:hypothetical protein
MLIEQAFFNLPEILVGSRYPTQDYEGGVVAAFSMAILQELNGRNVNNPISHLIAERIYQIDRMLVGNVAKKKDEARFRYQVNPFREGSGKPRYLRADLHVSLGGLRTGSAALARYGWRHSNWIEAKFFRDCFNSHSPSKPANGGHLAADLIRLMVLPPIEFPKKKKPVPQNGAITYPGTFTGRYLLHLYQGNPLNYQALRRNKSGDKPKGKRKWLEALLAEGSQKIESLDLGNEGDSFLAPLNQSLVKLGVVAGITNFVLKPIADEDREDAYWCILTRIDSFTVTLDTDSWSVQTNQIAIESSDGAFDRIRSFVGDHVHAKEKVEEVTPGQADLNAEGQNEEEEDEEEEEEEE